MGIAVLPKCTGNRVDTRLDLLPRGPWILRPEFTSERADGTPDGPLIGLRERSQMKCDEQKNVRQYWQADT